MMPSLSEIRRLREKLNITQKELSQMTGFSQSYIARLERNELNPTYESIGKYSMYWKMKCLKGKSMSNGRRI